MKAPWHLAVMIGCAVALGLWHFSPRFRGWCRRVLQWARLMPRPRPVFSTEPPSTVTISAMVQPGERVELDWYPDEWVLWVGLQTQTDVHEEERNRWPKPPEIVGVELGGAQLLQSGGLVLEMPCTLKPGCRVRVSLESKDSIAVAVKVHFQYRRRLPVAELGAKLGPITTPGA